MPGGILCSYGLGTKCRTVTDKNGTSYLTIAGKEKQTTLGILGNFFSVISYRKLTDSTTKLKRQSFLGAFASCLHNLDRRQRNEFSCPLNMIEAKKL